jgi:hypothetical protein
MTALRKKQKWSAATGGNRAQTRRSRIAAAVAHDVVVVARLPITSPRRTPSLPRLEFMERRS